MVQLMACDERIDVEYDGGYFDKDEQGWRADPTRVVQREDLLDVERSGHVTTFRLGRRYPHAGFVVLEPVSDPHPWWVLFDLGAGRLVGGRVPTTRMRTRPGPRSLDDPTAAIAPLLEGCVAGMRVVFPASAVRPPPRDAVRDLLSRPGDPPRLDLPADPGPGAYLAVWRAQGALSGCTARSATPAGDPYVAVGLRSSGEVDLHVGVGERGLEVMDAAFAAIEAAL